MSAIILQDEILHYEVLGRGKPLIFLHDWVGSWRYWIPTMQALSISYRTYALDFWGFGDSAKNPSKYSLVQQTDLLEDFMSTLGIVKAALIGHGLGAITAMLYASRSPNTVDRIFAAGAPPTEESIHSRMRNSAPEDLAYWLLGRNPSTEAAVSEASKADPKAITQSLSNLQNQVLTSLPGSVNNPILFIHGLNDPAIQAPASEQMNRLPENTHFVVFDDSGHFPMLDEPTKFNRLLTDFLNLNHAASPRQLQLREEWKRRVR